MTVIGVTDVVSLNQKKQKSNVFGLRWLKNTPTSETVGNGLCAVPGTSLDITRAGKWYHACRGGAPRSESKSIDCRWQSHHDFFGNLPPATFRIQPVWMNGVTLRYVIPTEAKRSGGIYPSSNDNLRKVKSATWEDSSTHSVRSE